MTLSNFAAYMAQMTIVVIACAAIPRLLGLRSPAVQYLFWRIVLVVGLALPLLQPRQPLFVSHTATAVPVTAPAAPAAGPVAVAPVAEKVYSLPFDMVSRARSCSSRAACFVSCGS